MTYEHAIELGYTQGRTEPPRGYVHKHKPAIVHATLRGELYVNLPECRQYLVAPIKEVCPCTQ